MFYHDVTRSVVTCRDISPQLGFFRRAQAPPPAVPQFRAVRIPREQRPGAREGRTGTIHRQPWAGHPDTGHSDTGHTGHTGHTDGPRTPGSA
uniref:Uncharacterized protein n=1 Tax=Cyanoderma ruficeps TaxID=181631 RepID=A0A8C3R3F9_9PASS